MTTTASTNAPRISTRKPIDLALQGGGSHGAFTWGVLDALLEDERFDFSAISGTSAGALNAAVMVSGFAKDGRTGARQALTDFWHDISSAGGTFSPFSGSQQNAVDSSYGVDKLPGYQWMSSFFRSFSPYEFNPLNLNPLRKVLHDHVNLQALHSSDIDLFITATSVRTGQARVFTGPEISIDALLASACLPFVFQAIEIDGEPYWDGGYTGNPALFPLIYDSQALDLLLVKINPLSRPGVPKRTVDIIDRVSEITFNASLIGEMRAISFVTRLLKENKLDSAQYKSLRLHMVADDEGLSAFNANSKFDTNRAFLEQLFRLGRIAAERWLAMHSKNVGIKSTLDIDAEFLGKSAHKNTAKAP